MAVTAVDRSKNERTNEERYPVNDESPFPTYPTRR
jgi:hypothetical protein